nr:hypothetical protein CFP56_24052 [Quercus suber]
MTNPLPRPLSLFFHFEHTCIYTHTDVVGRARPPSHHHYCRELFQESLSDQSPAYQASNSLPPGLISGRLPPLPRASHLSTVHMYVSNTTLTLSLSLIERALRQGAKPTRAAASPPGKATDGFSARRPVQIGMVWHGPAPEAASPRFRAVAVDGGGVLLSEVAAVGLGAAALAAGAHVTAAGAAAAHAEGDEPGEDGGPGGDPHVDEHLDAEGGADVERGDAGDGVLHDDEHDGGEDGGDGGEEGGEEGEDAEGEVGPAGVDGEGQEEDEQEAETGAARLGERVSREEWTLPGEGKREGRTRGAGEQLALDDGDGIEPVEGLRVGAVGDALAIVALTEVPEADGVEVVQTKGLGETVDEHAIGEGGGDDVGEVEADEVDVVANRGDAGVADLDEDDEDDGDEEEEGGEQSPDEASAGGAFDLGLGRRRQVAVVGRVLGFLLAAEHGRRPRRSRRLLSGVDSDCSSEFDG